MSARFPLSRQAIPPLLLMRGRLINDAMNSLVCIHETSNCRRDRWNHPQIHAILFLKTHASSVLHKGACALHSTSDGAKFLDVAMQAPFTISSSGAFTSVGNEGLELYNRLKPHLFLQDARRNKIMLASIEWIMIHRGRSFKFDFAMGHEQVDLEALPPPEDDQMVTCELEAAEALAGLARCSAGEAVVTPSHSSQDQPIAAGPFCGYASTTITSPERTETIVKNVSSQLCSTSCQPNPGSKFKQKLTEAEKEARKLRRVLANRESARQTIRRRQAMYLELTRKAADMLEENENLKKKKELAVEDYNLLKGKNEFLKAQLAKIKQAEPGEKQEEPKTSLPEKSCPATTCTPTFFHNQPSVVPFFWPSILPSSDLVQFHCASGSNVMSSQQFAIPHRDIPCPHQGQENSTGLNSRQGTPFIVLPVPWLLPCLNHSSMLHPNSCINDKQNTQPRSSSSCSETRLHEDKNQSSSSYNARAEARNSTKAGSASGGGFNIPTDGVGQCTACHPRGAVSVPELFSSVRPQEGHRPTRTSRVENTSGVNVSATHGTRQKNQEPSIGGLHKKPENMFAATEARRRRKELMRLRNINCHHVQTRC